MKAIISHTILLVILFFACEISFSQTKIPYGNNKESGNFIAINGVNHYYEIYGKGTPLLLIHGNGTGIKGWAAQIEFFRKKYKVYAIDCRGRGKSELGKDSLSFMQMANDMAVFIKEMKMDSVYIVGKSDGGIIAILMGIYYPERFKKIVAFGANMWADSTAFFTETVKNCHDERVEAERMLEAGDTTKNWLVEQQRYRLDEFQPNISAADLHKIKIPVLVMSCDRDLIREEHTFFIYKNIPKANLSIFPNEIHGVPKLNPDLFNNTIDKYLSRPFQGHEKRF